MALTCLKFHPTDSICLGCPELCFLLSPVRRPTMFSLGSNPLHQGQEIAPRQTARVWGSYPHLICFLLLKIMVLLCLLSTARKYLLIYFVRFLQLFVCWRVISYQFIHYIHIFLILIFYCYSITVVWLFSPSLHPTPVKPLSLPHFHPPPWFCPCVLYSSSCNPLSSLSPPHSRLSIVRSFLTSMSLVIFCFLFFLFIMFQLKVRSYGMDGTGWMELESIMLRWNKPDGEGQIHTYLYLPTQQRFFECL